MEESNKLLNDKIDYWSKSLAERISEIRFLNLEDMSTAIKANLKMAMMDCLKAQLSATEKQRNEIKKNLYNLKGDQRAYRARKLSEINAKLKKENMLYSGLNNDNKAREMTLWMRENHPESILKFYENYDLKSKQLA